jgi:hypothetical protein
MAPGDSPELPDCSGGLVAVDDGVLLSVPLAWRSTMLNPLTGIA